MNKVILSGRLTRDPEIRYVGKDNLTCLARFTLAVDRHDKDGTADFISCKMLGKRAEWIEKYIHRGSRIELDGCIQSGSYENERGDKVYYTEVLAYNAEFGESKKDSQNQTTESPTEPTDQNADQAAGQGSQRWGFMDIPEGSTEDMPFQ